MAPESDSSEVTFDERRALFHLLLDASDGLEVGDMDDDHDASLSITHHVPPELLPLLGR